MIELMELPFAKNALKPFISAKTIEFHYTRHHKAYADKTNELISGTDFQNMPLEEIIRQTYNIPENQTLYNNASQVYNHNIYWNSVHIGKKLDFQTKTQIISSFGSPEALKEKLTDEALKIFGSGWVWLVKDKQNRYDIISTQNGDTPLVLDYTPIFNIDIWEHAYYLDYQNRRKEYTEKFISGVLII